MIAVPAIKMEKINNVYPFPHFFLDLSGHLNQPLIAVARLEWILCPPLDGGWYIASVINYTHTFRLPSFN